MLVDKCESCWHMLISDTWGGGSSWQSEGARTFLAGLGLSNNTAKAGLQATGCRCIRQDCRAKSTRTTAAWERKSSLYPDSPAEACGAGAMHM